MDSGNPFQTVAITASSVPDDFCGKSRMIRLMMFHVVAFEYFFLKRKGKMSQYEMGRFIELRNKAYRILRSKLFF
jgi:hypothetical protein